MLKIIVVLLFATGLTFAVRGIIQIFKEVLQCLRK
jgi:hypothetical protein